MELRQQLEKWKDQSTSCNENAAADMHVAKRLLKHGIEALDEIENLRSMYNAQCSCTDEWAEKYRVEVERKADATLTERIDDLELSLRLVNARLAEANERLAICTETPNVK